MGFNHSVKVPTQYKKAAAIFRKSVEKKQSVKTLLYEEKHAKIPNLFSLLTKYSKNKNQIENAIEESKILVENSRMDPYLCRVLVAELLVGAKKLNGESKPVQVVRSYEKQLQELFDKCEAEPGQDFIKKPRYVRINTNLCTIEEAIQQLESEKWRKKTYDQNSYEEYLKAIRELEEDEFIVDIHMNEVLVFTEKWKSYLAQHQFTQEKKFILQDKATCLVAKLLDPPKNSIVLDTCAAPGMKTIHLSNIMENQGTIYAVEQNPGRFKILCSMIENGSATSVKPVQGDAIKLSAKDYPGIQYVLVDPTCSGSGMQSRLSLEPREVEDPNRLYKLAGLQISILQHVMTEFPDVKRIAYSTCSIYEEENEQVVQKCLERCPQWKLLNGKKSLRKLWKNCGSQDYKGIGKNCLYARPQDDLTDGIFIAIFEKIKNQFD